jgi:hypothetical protein
MLASDFNLIYHTEDKNSDRLHYCLMGQFHRFLNVAALQEVRLNSRLFTWSNKCAHPTLERIDRVFIFIQWDAIFPDCELHSLSSLCSDHAPLLLCTDSGHQIRSISGHSGHIFQVPGGGAASLALSVGQCGYLLPARLAHAQCASVLEELE